MPKSAKLFAGEVVMDKHAIEAPDLEPHQEIECSELTKKSTRMRSTSKELNSQFSNHSHLQFARIPRSRDGSRRNALGPKLFFVTGLVIFVIAVAILVCPDLLG